MAREGQGNLCSQHDDDDDDDWWNKYDNNNNNNNNDNNNNGKISIFKYKKQMRSYIWIIASLNLEFEYSKIGFLSKAKESSLPYCLPIIRLGEGEMVSCLSHEN